MNETPTGLSASFATDGAPATIRPPRTPAERRQEEQARSRDELFRGLVALAIGCTIVMFTWVVAKPGGVVFIMPWPFLYGASRLWRAFKLSRGDFVR